MCSPTNSIITVKLPYLDIRILNTGHVMHTGLNCHICYSGCCTVTVQRLICAHIKEGMEAHLSLLSLVPQEVPKLQTVVQQQGDQIKQQADQIKQQADQIKQQGDQIKQQADQIKQQGDQIKQQADQIKQQGDQIKQQADQIKQQADQIKQQGDQIKQQGDQMKQMENRIKQLEKPFPPVHIIMDDFEQHKRSNDIWYSPPFYTHLGGYRTDLSAYANGCGGGKGTHVSVFVHLMRGEFDDLLKWLFRGDVTIQLKKNDPPHYQKILPLNDDTPNKSVCKPTKVRNAGWCYSQFITRVLICMLVDT